MVSTAPDSPAGYPHRRPIPTFHAPLAFPARLHTALERLVVAG